MQGAKKNGLWWGSLRSFGPTRGGCTYDIKPLLRCNSLQALQRAHPCRAVQGRVGGCTLQSEQIIPYLCRESSRLIAWAVDQACKPACKSSAYKVVRIWTQEGGVYKSAEHYRLSTLN